jgi:DNA ligase D-like protein (predicted ligase)
MLAQLAKGPFDSDQFLFEIKWDGTRCLAFIERDKLRLQNRRFLEMRDRYPELAGLMKLPAGTLLDGEIVILADGSVSFKKLQEREHLTNPFRIELARQRLPALFIAFDLLYLRGHSLLEQPLLARREQLSRLVENLSDSHVAHSDFILKFGRRYFEAVERRGLEGIMAKRIDSPYLPGKRSPNWLKIKVAQTREFEIIGYVPREGANVVSALLLGERHGRSLVFRGKVGSGFTEDQRRQFFQDLVDAPPLKRAPDNGPAGAVWRSAGLRCRVRFYEENLSGKLRAPVFMERVVSH